MSELIDGMVDFVEGYPSQLHDESGNLIVEIRGRGRMLYMEGGASKNMEKLAIFVRDAINQAQKENQKHI